MEQPLRAAEHLCAQCGKLMGPIEWVMGPVCCICCRKNHKRVTKGGK